MLKSQGDSAVSFLSFFLSCLLWTFNIRSLHFPCSSLVRGGIYFRPKIKLDIINNVLICMHQNAQRPFAPITALARTVITSEQPLPPIPNPVHVQLVTMAPTVLVIGGLGFLVSHIVGQLTTGTRLTEWDVVVIDLHEPSEKERVADVRYCVGDLGDKGKIVEVFEEVCTIRILPDDVRIIK